MLKLKEICKSNSVLYSGSDEPLSPLKAFFNCCFVTCTVPFQVKWNAEQRKYILVCNRIQKVICALFHFLVIIFFLEYIVQLYSDKKDEDQKSFIKNGFSLVENLFTRVLYVLFVKMVWANQKDLADLLNILSGVCGKRRNGKSVYSLLKFLGLLGFLLMTLVSSLDLKHHRAVRNLNEGHSSACHPSVSLVEWMELGWNIVKVHIFTFYFVNCFFLFVLAASMLGMASDHCSSLRLKRLDVTKGIETYRTFRKEVAFINNLVGWHILTFYIIMIAHLGKIPDVIMGFITEESVVSCIVYFAIGTSFWVLAAEIHENVQKGVLIWVDIALFESSAPLSFENRMTLMTIKTEIYWEPVALSCKFFSITYSFLKTMIGLCLTYGIITAQTHSEGGA